MAPLAYEEERAHQSADVVARPGVSTPHASLVVGLLRQFVTWAR